MTLWETLGRETARLRKGQVILLENLRVSKSGHLSAEASLNSRLYIISNRGLLNSTLKTYRPLTSAYQSFCCQVMIVSVPDSSNDWEKCCSIVCKQCGTNKVSESCEFWCCEFCASNVAVEYALVFKVLVSDAHGCIEASLSPSAAQVQVPPINDQEVFGCSAIQFMQADHDEKWAFVYSCVAKEFDVVIARYRDESGVDQRRIDVASECQTSTHNARGIVEALGGVFGKGEHDAVPAWLPKGNRIGVVNKSMSGLDVRKKGRTGEIPRHKSSVEVRQVRKSVGQFMGSRFQAQDPLNPFA